MNSDREWDEYEWERFLQQQDRKTEKYMDLLERFIDHPERDSIIAREMGWNHLPSEDGDDGEGAFFELAFDAGDDDDLDDEDDEDDEDFQGEDDDDVSFESHPLYQAAFALTVWIDHAVDSGQENQEMPPAAVQLSTQVALCSAKLAAALSGDEEEEVGMTIAYLKRALRAISLALDAALALERERVLSPQSHTEFRSRAFSVRDEIIRLMGAYREQWRGLHGA